MGAYIFKDDCWGFGLGHDPNRGFVSFGPMGGQLASFRKVWR